MILYLAGAETWDKLMYDCDVRFALGSYFYLKDKSEKVLRRLLTNFEQVFLDSGAFTLRQHLRLRNAHISEEEMHNQVMEYIDEYAEFLNRYGEEFNEVAEIDVGHWQQKTRYREHLMSQVKTNINLMPVVHSRDPDRYVEFLCNKYNNVAFATRRTGTKRQNINYMEKRFLTAKRYNAPIHGFAVTTPEVINKLGFYSVDSATWVHAMKHGMTFIFRKNKFFMYDNMDKWVRVKLKNEVKNMGLDWDKFMDDHPKTVHRFSLMQWVKYQNYLYEDAFTQKQEEFWREGRENSV